MELEPLRPSNLIRVMPAKGVRSDVLPRIHCITDFASYGARTLAVREAVVGAGVDAVQVRANRNARDAEVAEAQGADHGVAVASAICRSDHPERAARVLAGAVASS